MKIYVDIPKPILKEVVKIWKPTALPVIKDTDCTDIVTTTFCNNS
jgi:hypothetical protein